jgi:membrane glycosyltransferase
LATHNLAIQLHPQPSDNDVCVDPWSWLPDESPLDMPRQSLTEDYAWNTVAPETSPAEIRRRRFIVFGATALLTGLAMIAPLVLYARAGFDRLEMIAFGLFLVLISAIACWFCSAMAGLIVMMTGREQEDLDFAPHPPMPTTRTAVLMPLYNEDARASFARLASIDSSLARLGVSDAFDLFVLSDSTKAEAQLSERLIYQTFRLKSFSKAFYRRRAQNTEHKAGNLSDWTKRFGGAYDFMVVLDADSTMAGETLLRLVDAMERNPGVGLIQTTPVIIGAQTLYARLSQFSVRMYGRVAAAGLAWWTGAESSYWGHNAILRTQAFASCAGLPILEGEKPFGGNVLSHDVVEAALLRRAGWAVHVTAALDGSCEETPPTLTDFIRRDHRWCQGNLQHLGLIGAKGLSPISRLQLAMGCMAYISSPLWFASLAIGLVIQLQYPTDWGSFFYMLDPQFTPFMLASVFCGLLLIGPKLMGGILVLSRRRERRAFGGTSQILHGMLMEVFLSAVLAPIQMVANTRAILLILRGGDAGWHAQSRDTDGLAWGDAFHAMAWQMATGLAFCAGLFFRPDLATWFAPVVLPLLLSPALVVLTSRRRTGETFAKAGYLITPAEDAFSATPAVLYGTVRPAAGAMVSPIRVAR